MIQKIRAYDENRPECEVRIPTYKRPETLRRTIESLQQQTYPFWKAVILDNSSEQEAKSIVTAANDDRIIYQPHPKNIGGAKNIDLSLQPKSMLGCKYACALEDDNYLYPASIEENIETLKRENVSILLRNQEIRTDSKDGIPKATGDTTRGQWFKKGTYSPFDLYAMIFFCEGLSNGGLFWDTETIKTNFTLGDFYVQDGWYQEIFRSLRVTEPIFFDPRVGSVYTILEDYKSASRGSNLPALFSTHPRYNRMAQAILRHLIKVYGEEIIERAKAIAAGNEENLRTLEYQLLNAIYTKYPFQYVSMPERVLLIFKHSVRNFYSGNSFEEALKSLTHLESMKKTSSM